MKNLSFAFIAALVLSPLVIVHAQDNPNLDDLLNQLSTDDTAAATTTTAETTSATTTQDPTFDAPEIKILNTTYTFQGNEYTLSFTPIPGSAKVELSVKNADTDMDYTKVETVAASAGTAKINLTSQGTYMIKFTPVDDLGIPLGPDQIMTIKVEAPIDNPTTPTNPETTVQNPPQVGPASDLLFGGLILIAIVYFVYRFRSNDA